MKKRALALLLAAALLLTLCPAALAVYTERSFSDGVVEYLKAGEGFSPSVYSDGTGWYIGYGTACGAGDYPGGITEAEGEALLRAKLQLFANDVNAFLKKYDLAVSQGQFDALCAMSYNFGSSWLDPGNRLPSYIINGTENYSDEEICSAFAVWCHVGGAVNTGLLTRRIAEAKMFLYEDYSGTAAGWCWAILNADGGTLPTGDVVCAKTGALWTNLPVPSREGYSFAGWYTAAGEKVTGESAVSGNLKLTARWTEGEAPAGPEPEPVFPDVTVGDWYYDYVTALVEEGVFAGYEDGTFRPDEPVTWGQALKLVLLAAGYPEQAPAETGEGEAPAHWASGYLAYAEKKGFVAKDAVTDLDAPVSRNDIADLCAAALALSRPEDLVNPFDDTERDSVLALYAAGILEGSIENGRRLYKGGDSIRRSEICAVLCRTMDYVDQTLILYLGYRIPINHDLEMCAYDLDRFRSEGGRIYYEDESLSVRYGIDVSEHQGQIDWARVAADGIDFAMIRAGYRGYSRGGLNEDPYFRTNIENALANGLDVGVYFFSQAVSVEEAMEEFDFLMGLIDGYEITFPVVFDWEPVNAAGSRTSIYNIRVVDDCTVAFCEAVEQAGYIPMTYFNPSMAYLKHDMTRLDGYPAWLANYAQVPNYIYDYQMWQYSSSGSVDGISTRVDLNIAFVDFAAE
ncbi:MAG: GH25 family lysozyme [Oscillospiraceae bacterium]